MKFMILLITILAAFAGSSFGKMRDVDQQHLPHYNMIQNPGFENGKAKWTASGSSTFTLDTTTELFGTTSAKWNASAASETFSSNPQTIPEGLETRACLGYIKYRWASGTAGHLVLKVLDGSANVLGSSDIAVSSETAPWFVAFPCPAGTTMTLQIASTADAAEITLDQMWPGENFLQGESGPYVGDWESYPLVPNSSNADAAIDGTPARDSALKKRIGSSLLIRYELKQDSGGTTGTGTYVFPIPSGLTIDTSQISASADGYVLGSASAYNSTNGFATGHAVAYDSGNIAILVGDETTAPALVGAVWHNFGNTDLRLSFEADVPILEWAGSGTSDKVTLETQGLYYQGYHSTGCGWYASGTTMTDVTVGDSGGCSFGEKQNSGFTITSRLTGGNPLPGIEAIFSRTAMYHICALARFGSTAAQPATFTLYDGTIDFAEVMVKNTDNDDTHVLPLCGLYNVTDLATTKSIRIRGKTPSSNFYIGNDSQDNGNEMNLVWIIYPITQNFPQAVVLPDVTSFVRVDTVNGYGSTNAVIRRFSNVTDSAGACITYADSATLGGSFTINCDGMYSASLTDVFSSSAVTGISLNSSQLTSNIVTINASDRLAASNSVGSNLVVFAGWSGPLESGDVIRIHTAGAANGADPGRATFTLTRVH